MIHLSKKITKIIILNFFNAFLYNDANYKLQKH